MRTIFLLLLFSNVRPLSAQSPQARLDAYFSRLAAARQFNGGILVAEKGRIVYEASFGFADVAKREPLQRDSRFPFASVSKTLTATAVLQLVEKKQLQLDTPVVRYLTWFPYPAIKLRHLLSHTSGLPAYNAYFDSLRQLQPQRRFTNADVAQAMARKPVALRYTPGSRSNYDNVNYLILALVLERVSGLPYPDLIRKMVLQPAGMQHTLFYPPARQYAENNRDHFALPHLYPHQYSDSAVRAKDVAFIRDYWSAYQFSGFADYLGTARDLLRFDEAYYSNRLLPETVKKQMFEPVILEDGSATRGSFGLGWEITRDSGLGTIVYHNGNATGLSCVLLRLPTKQQTVIVYDNLHSNNAQLLAFTALSILNGRPAPAIRSSLAAVYGRTLVRKGPEAARAQMLRLRSDTARYYLDEEELNLLGYDLMGGDNFPNPYHFPEVRRYKDALEVFRLNTELFPNSWNVYDSYGEILMTLGRKEEAIRMYRRSIELNPQNEGGRKMLKKLQEQ